MVDLLTEKLASLPVWDREKLLARMGNDQPLVEMLLSTFINQWTTLSKELEDCLNKGDCKRLSRVAHTMKGAAANLEAARIRELSHDLDKLAASGLLEEINGLVLRLQDQYRMFLQECGR